MDLHVSLRCHKRNKITLQMLSGDAQESGENAHESGENAHESGENTRGCLF